MPLGMVLAYLHAYVVRKQHLADVTSIDKEVVARLIQLLFIENRRQLQERKAI